MSPAHPSERLGYGQQIRRRGQQATPSALSPESPGQLGVERRCCEGLVTVALVGELDVASAPLPDAELRALANLVVVDLCALSFMDCAGLRVLLAAAARLRETDRRLVLTNCSRQVRRLLDLTGVNARLEGAWAPGDPAAEPAGQGRCACVAEVGSDDAC